MSFATALAPVTPVQLAMPAPGGSGGAAAASGSAAGEPAACDFARALDAAGAAPAAGVGTPADDAGTAAGPGPRAVERSLRAAVRPAVHVPPVATAAAAERAPTSNTHDTAAAVHSPLQVAATPTRPGRPDQPAAPVSVSEGQPTGHDSPQVKLDGDDARSVAADTPTATPAATSAAAIDPATLLAELRARHPAREAAPVPSALEQRDSDTMTAAATRPVRRPPPLSPAVNSPSQAVEPAVVAPPRQPSPSAIDALPVAAASAADKASTPPPALSPPGLSQPMLAPSPLQAAAVATPVAEVHLPAAPGSAEFTAQLGAQLTTFVRDGVQHARLHLNPAEMGPVTVQIQLDGQSAQVHLAAEHGLTRQALEQSMPLLAGSLREAGLTLSGGGVFEQPRQPRGAPGSPDASHRGDDIGAEPTPHPAAAAARRRGVVDLIA